MDRLRALSFSAFVALSVFMYLALPTLRELYGPAVELPVYALVALTAGRLTWVLLADRSTEHDPASLDSDTSTDPTQTDGTVDDELQALREEQ